MEYERSLYLEKIFGVSLHLKILERVSGFKEVDSINAFYIQNRLLDAKWS